MIEGNPYSIQWWLSIHNIYSRKGVALMLKYLNAQDNDALREYEHCYEMTLWIQKRLIFKYDTE